MDKKIIVLGCGLVGRSIAEDLAMEFETTAADIETMSFGSLSKSGVRTIKADLTDQDTLKKLVSAYDLVIGALPGNMGYKTLESAIKAGKDIVDISFMPEDYLRLDELAKSKGVTAIADCGVAPGMSNIILGYHYKRMNINTFKCFVGGLPLVREWPYQYKAVFSPIDVIEEYTRPARYLENGTLVTKEALTDIEILDCGQAGKLEAWNSDGLRSLIKTMPVPNMIEKTLRFPGTTEYIKVLRDTGFFSYKDIEIRGQKLRPIDLTIKLLFPLWKMKPGEGDFTVMKIIIQGDENGKPREYIYDLYDEYERASGTLSMARTTGYTCTAAANLILRQGYRSPGVKPPEYIGGDEKNFRFIMDFLKKRNVIYNVEVVKGRD
jgi:saccharopine dehydrogenase-like NADP-dependent oxidoreductase